MTITTAAVSPSRIYLIAVYLNIILLVISYIDKILDIVYATFFCLLFILFFLKHCQWKLISMQIKTCFPS